MTTDEKLDLILARIEQLETLFKAMDGRITSELFFLKDQNSQLKVEVAAVKLDTSQNGTRLEKIGADIRDIKQDVRLLREDIRNERKERVELAERIENLEGRP